MNNQQAVLIFEALSSEVRLDIFKLLMKHGTAGLVAGDIAEALNLPNTNLSFHLKNLYHAGIIEMQKEGRFVRYSIKMPAIFSLINFLLGSCCVESMGCCDISPQDYPSLIALFSPQKSEK